MAKFQTAAALIAATPDVQPVPRQAAGSGTTGLNFEGRVAGAWGLFLGEVVRTGGTVTKVRTWDGSKRAVEVKGLRRTQRRLYLSWSKAFAGLPTQNGNHAARVPGLDPQWVATSFPFDEAVSSANSQFAKTAPSSGPYVGAAYPDMYRGLSMRQDFAIACVDAQGLAEQMLFEYKYAKPTSGDDKLAGNAHERLSFQLFIHREAGRISSFPRSLNVILSPQYSRNRSKYFAGFSLQALRINEEISVRRGTGIVRVAADEPSYLKLFNDVWGFLATGALPTG